MTDSGDYSFNREVPTTHPLESVELEIWENLPQTLEITIWGEEECTFTTLTARQVEDLIEALQAARKQMPE